MRTYQVPECKYGYTFIELLVVVIIIGIFFYLIFPTVKNILPEEENKKISDFVDVIEKASRRAIDQKQKVIFIIDIDTGSYDALTEEEMKEASDMEGEGLPPFTESPLTFIRAQNSLEEVSSGRLTFLFFPDGSKEFGLISVRDIDNDEVYTIFLNPYTISPEVIKGDIRFEED